MKLTKNMPNQWLLLMLPWSTFVLQQGKNGDWYCSTERQKTVAHKLYSSATEKWDNQFTYIEARYYQWVFKKMSKIESHSLFVTLICIHTYFNIMERTYARMHQWCWFRLSITHHMHEAQNMYETRTDTWILTRRLCVSSAYCSLIFLLKYLFYFFVTATTTKTVNCDEWLASLTNQTYFEWYEFDVKVVRIPRIATL